MTLEYDFIVIGAGMAGASAAAHLAARGKVALLEAEDQPGYHTTGRSAAVFSQIYGNRVIRALTRASRAFLFDPPPGFAEAHLVRPRPTMYFARAGQMPSLHRFRSDADVAAATRMLSAQDARELVPAFTDDSLAGAALETDSADIDVHALHHGFLKLVRRHGGQLHVASPVTALTQRAGRWVVTTSSASLSAPIVVNAAGAWADRVARQAGAQPVGLRSLRRTVALIDVPPPLSAEHWPTSVDVDEQLYFKPDAGALLLSPADETPCEPCDAQPEELDVAIAIDRFEQATGRSVRRVRHRWAGLRVFAQDRSPVIGFDAQAPGFFWLAGPGGYGVQTAPALGRVAASLVCDGAMPGDIVACGVSDQDLSPRRCASRA